MKQRPWFFKMGKSRFLQYLDSYKFHICIVNSLLLLLLMSPTRFFVSVATQASSSPPPSRISFRQYFVHFTDQQQQSWCCPLLLADMPSGLLSSKKTSSSLFSEAARQLFKEVDTKQHSLNSHLAFISGTDVTFRRHSNDFVQNSNVGDKVQILVLTIRRYK